MARPEKNNAEYFSHDSDMRNDPRVKAIRRKFGLDGYAVWNMILELLADSDFFKHKWDELQIEIISGDFDIDPRILRGMVNYFLTLDLLQIEDEYIKSEQLIKRLNPLLQKRETRRQRVLDKQNEKEKGLRPSETTQSKVKESKVKINNKNIEVSKGFLDVWAKARMGYLKKPTNIPKLNMHEKLLINEALKTYSWEEIKESIHGLFKQENIEIKSMLLTPTHFLNNITKYYNAELSKEYQLYGAKK